MPAVFDLDAGTVTFKTTHFSTYAVCVLNKPVTTPDKENHVSDKSDKEGGKAVEVYLANQPSEASTAAPKTGDTSNAQLWGIVMAAVLAAGIVMIRHKKSES